MKTLRIHIVLLILCLSSLTSMGQDSVSTLRPLELTTVRKNIYDIYLFCQGGLQSNSNVWTANNYGVVTHLYGTYLSLGSTIETKLFNFLTVGYSLGYKYEPYSYSKNLFNPSRFNTHWLSNDVHISVLYLGLGFKTDVFLEGSLKSNNNYDMVGINSNCFNKVAMAGYVNYTFRFTNFKFDINLGWIYRKKLNVDKLAYYNMHKSYAGGWYWEAKISYRIFTTGNRLKSQSQFGY